MIARDLMRRIMHAAPPQSMYFDVVLWHEGTRLEPDDVVVDVERKLVILRCVER